MAKHKTTHFSIKHILFCFTFFRIIPFLFGVGDVGRNLIKVPYDLGKNIRINKIIYYASDYMLGHRINVMCFT